MALQVWQLYLVYPDLSDLSIHGEYSPLELNGCHHPSVPKSPAA